MKIVRKILCTGFIFSLLMASGATTLSMPGIASSATKKAKAKQPAGPRKQIFEASHSILHSDLLNADGVAAYVVSTMGTNRGFLIKELSGGLANNIGMSEGDVVMSFDSHVVQDARDVDRVLGRIPSGNVKVMFVHPGDAGLQLYNGSFRYTNVAPTTSTVAQSIGAHSGGSKSSSAGGGDQASPVSSVESYMVELINADRRNNGGLKPIHSNSALTSIARAHATDMLKRNFFAHVNPDGLSPQDRARNAGISGGVYENIAFETVSGSPASFASHAEQVFMSEPKNQENHRSNILGANHVSVGCAAVMVGNKLMMVQDYSDRDP